MDKIELFEGLAQGLIEGEGGYITTSFFDLKSNYCHFETVQFEAVKNIQVQEDGVNFQSDGKKLFVLFEPKEFIQKHVEPAFREEDKLIPYRFAELDIVTTSRDDKLMISKIPHMAYNSFTIARPGEGNFAYYFFNRPNVLDNLLNFYGNIFLRDLHISRPVIAKALERIKANLSAFKDFS